MTVGLEPRAAVAAADAPVPAPRFEAAPSPGLAAPLPPCLIVNPRSFRAARGLADAAATLAAAHGAEVVRADRPAALHAAVDAVLAQRRRQLVVLAGDGTVSAIVDRLATLAPGAWRPDLLLLAGGRTNLTAKDVATRRGGALATLGQALRRHREHGALGGVVERVVLRVAQAPAPPRHGFFVAGASIDAVIRRIHVHHAGGSGALRGGHFGTPWGVLGLGLRALVGRSGLSCPRLGVDAAGLGALDGPMRLLLVSTLAHGSGLFDPYPARGSGDLRVTAVARRAPRFWRSLPRLLTGRYTAAMDPAHGYLGGRCGRLEVGGLAGYALDGETIDTDPTRPVVVTPGPRLRFLDPWAAVAAGRPSGAER